MVVDTGSWLSGRLVLISPHVFTNFDVDGVSRRVKLTKKQIESSPALASHKPVSRQYEEEYYSYYGWPTYWDGGGLWGMSPVPIVERTTDPRSPAQFHAETSPVPGVDSHLRSTQALNGYHIQTKEGALRCV